MDSTLKNISKSNTIQLSDKPYRPQTQKTEIKHRRKQA